jgi:hypothetical protein
MVIIRAMNHGFTEQPCLLIWRSSCLQLLDPSLHISLFYVINSEAINKTGKLYVSVKSNTAQQKCALC